MIPILVYICSAYICRGYTNLVDYCLELMVYCFIADEEMFQGTQRFADSKLRAFFDTFGQEVRAGSSPKIRPRKRSTRM